MTSTHDTLTPPPTVPAAARLLDLVMGNWRAGVVSAFAELGVADALRDEKLTPASIARHLGLANSTCTRFCTAAAAVGLLDAGADGTVSLSELGRTLLSESPGSMRNFARWCGSTADRTTWSQLHTAVRTGRSPFPAIHGTDVWEFLQTRPADAAVFDAAMTELSRNVIGPVVGVLDLTSFSSVTDVGGGRGALLAAILKSAPHLRGVLFDQADVVSLAPDVLRSAGVADRVTIIAGSFFDSVPSGSDLFVISNVLHDWDDDRTRAILGSISSAMSPGHQIAIVEAVAGVDDRFDEAIALMDMDMLALCEGKQRTVGEFRDLLAEFGLTLTAIDRAGLQSVVRATKTD
ncbi:methyltransferase [Amycolatopsis sp. cmx-4-83]|uniref:methyltransferase n=1 Tax=Amycolatopsis sp. cmx-4-83 TaxID=2790940 RepID=UPI0039797B54